MIIGVVLPTPPALNIWEKNQHVDWRRSLRNPETNRRLLFKSMHLQDMKGLFLRPVKVGHFRLIELKVKKLRIKHLTYIRPRMLYQKGQRRY
jgi:hypothetical protein